MKDFKNDFRILKEKVNGSTIAYLDNGATTQKPFQVIEAVEKYNKLYNGNPHRGAHYLSIKATELYENARKKVAKFIGIKDSREIIFTKNATEALNLIAYSYGMNSLKKGDEILLSITNHHSNIVPWQMVAKKTGAKIVYLNCDEKGQIKKEDIDEKINENTKIISISHLTNVFGVVHPIEYIIEKGRKYPATIIVDGAQSVPHMNIDMEKLNPDFLVFSGHKMLSSMGIGVLYGKIEKLEKMEPFLFGGDMIEYVDFYDTSFNEVPYKFEAGTQNVEGAVSLSSAIDYIENIGIGRIESIEGELLRYTVEKMKENKYIEIYGGDDLTNRKSMISFNVKDVHPHDVATILDSDNIAIRAGHHCAQPFMKYMGLNSTCRASFYFYNTFEDIDRLIDSLKKVRGVLGYEY